MPRACTSALALAAIILLPGVSSAQGQPEVSRSVTGGGITVSGWMGKIDGNEEKQGSETHDLGT